MQIRNKPTIGGSMTVEYIAGESPTNSKRLRKLDVTRTSQDPKRQKKTDVVEKEDFKTEEAAVRTCTPPADHDVDSGQPKSENKLMDEELWDLNDHLTGSKIRDRIRARLSATLKERGTELGVNYVRLAVQIEEALWTDLEEAGSKKYTNQLREINFNLKDKKNPDFRSRVLMGKILPKELVTITSEQMASSAQKKAREKIKQWNFAAHSSELLLKKNVAVTLKCVAKKNSSIIAAGEEGDSWLGYGVDGSAYASDILRKQS